ncbi:hypothetical protein BC831DRAFT_32651 [Entophlyctis helioformis]|nr:hypothetical protein BC831DRAFT_32651 [Entophlyctis helioformis]
MRTGPLIGTLTSRRSMGTPAQAATMATATATAAMAATAAAHTHTHAHAEHASSDNDDGGDQLDPFEVHRQFRELLRRNLSASQIARIAHFAYEHRSAYEDLFEGLLDIMAQAQPHNRLNLLYIIDSLCKGSTKHKFDGYLSLTRAHLRDLIEAVIDCVRPSPARPHGGPTVDVPGVGTLLRHPSREGVANTSNVKRVLAGWKAKGIVGGEECNSLEALLATWSDKAVEGFCADAVQGCHLTPHGRRSRASKEGEGRAWVRPAYDDPDGYPPDPDPEFAEAWAKARPLCAEDETIMALHRDKMDDAAHDRAESKQPRKTLPSSAASSGSYKDSKQGDYAQWSASSQRQQQHQHQQQMDHLHQYQYQQQLQHAYQYPQQHPLQPYPSATGVAVSSLPAIAQQYSQNQAQAASAMHQQGLGHAAPLSRNGSTGGRPASPTSAYHGGGGGGETAAAYRSSAPKSKRPASSGPSAVSTPQASDVHVAPADSGSGKGSAATVASHSQSHSQRSASKGYQPPDTLSPGTSMAQHHSQQSAHYYHQQQQQQQAAAVQHGMPHQSLHAFHHHQYAQAVQAHVHAQAQAAGGPPPGYHPGHYAPPHAHAHPLAHMPPAYGMPPPPPPLLHRRRRSPSSRTQHTVALVVVVVDETGGRPADRRSPSRCRPCMAGSRAGRGRRRRSTRRECTRASMPCRGTDTGTDRQAAAGREIGGSWAGADGLYVCRCQ